MEDYEDPEILNFVDQRIKGNDLSSQYTMAIYRNLLEDRMA